MDYVIVPVVNPDGYEYTWSTNRMWRKNRHYNSSNSILYTGIDLNRNWAGPDWCKYGASKSTGSDTYCGPGWFSEKETQAVSSLYTKLLAEGPVTAAIDWHAYSQLILRPYGLPSLVPQDDALLTSAGAKMAATIKAIHGETYQNIPSYQLYTTTGTASDWYYGFGKEADQTPLSYTIELRDTGKYGFLLPASEIIPQGQEILAGMLEFSCGALTAYSDEYKCPTP